MRRRPVDLAERIDLLSRAVDLSEGRIPDDVVARARGVPDEHHAEVLTHWIGLCFRAVGHSL